MKEKVIRLMARGMAQDHAEARASNDLAYELRNIRISSDGSNTLFSISSIKGTEAKSSVPGRVVATTVIGDKAVILSKLGKDGMVFVFDGENIKKIYQTEMNLSDNVDMIGVVERDDIEKVYWVDGVNPLRSLNIHDKRLATNPDVDYINNTWSLTFEEEVSVTQSWGRGSKLHSGNVTYLFTYSLLHGKESKVFAESDVYYITHSDGRGGSGEDIINCSFDIEVTGLDQKADFVNVYRILRTSEGGTPDVQRVDSIPVKGTSVEFHDYGQPGISIEPQAILYLGSNTIIASTLAAKDNTLFLGNLSIPGFKLSEEEQREIKDHYATGNISFNPVDVDPFRANQAGKGHKDISVLMPYEQYPVAIQLISKTGQESNPVPVGVFTAPDQPSRLVVSPPPVIGDYVGYRVLIHYPSTKERRTIANGVLSPTLYTVADREDGVPYAFSSYCFRPITRDELLPESLGDMTVNKSLFRKEVDQPFFKSSSTTLGLASAQVRVCADVQTFNTPDIQDCYDEDVEIHVKTLGNPIESYVYRDTRLEEGKWNDMSAIYDHESLLRPSLSASISTTTRLEPGAEILRVSTLESDMVGVAMPLFSTKDTSGGKVVENTTARLSVYGQATTNESSFNCKASTWRNNGPSLQKVADQTYLGEVDKILPAIKGATSRFLGVDGKGKARSVQSVSGPTRMKYGTSDHFVIKFNKDDLASNHVKRDTLPASAIQDFINTMEGRWFTHDYDPQGGANLGGAKNCWGPVSIEFHDGDFPGTSYADVATTFFATVEEVRESMRPSWLTLDVDNGDQTFYYATPPGGVYWNKHEAMDDKKGKMRIIQPYTKDSGDVIDSNGVPFRHSIYKTDATSVGLWLMFASRKKIALGVGSSSSDRDDLRALIREIIKVTAEKLMRRYNQVDLSSKSLVKAPLTGSILPIAIMTREAPSYDIESLMWEAYSYVTPTAKSATGGGDAYYQTTTLFKTIPSSEANKVTDIIDIPLLTRVNQLGRYDRNIGIKTPQAMSMDNVNKMNDVYNDRMKLKTYDIIPDYMLTSYHPASFTWSKTKQNGEFIDNYTHFSGASTASLDGICGGITRILSSSDRLFFVQRQGIGLINYNSRVQVQASDGVPIEISNSRKVDGHRYMSKEIGTGSLRRVCHSASALYLLDDRTSTLYSLSEGLSPTSKQKSMQDYLSSTTGAVLLSEGVMNRIHVCTKEETLCYNEELQSFESFYDYKKIEEMFVLGQSVYSLSYGYLWRNESVYGTGLYGQALDWSIHYRVNPEGAGEDKIFTSLDVRGDTWDGDKLIELDLTHMDVWTEYQRTMGYGINFVTNYPSSMKEKFRIYRIQIPRDAQSKFKMDRIRNPWMHLRLHSKGGLLYKSIIHDITVHYYE